MMNCKSFLVTETERKHVRRRELSSSFFPPTRQAAEGNLRHSDRNIRGTSPSYATVKNWVAQFKRGDFSTCDASRPGRPKTVTTPKIIDQIHELILEDRRISAKSIVLQLGNSRERVGSIIHEDLNKWEALREMGPEMPERESKTSTVLVV